MAALLLKNTNAQTCLAVIFRACEVVFAPGLHFCFSAVVKCSPLHVLTCHDVVKYSFLPVACVRDKATFQYIQKEAPLDRLGLVVSSHPGSFRDRKSRL